MQKTVSLTVNGKPASATVEGRTLLVQLLREHLGLTGTHVGCDTSQCGACVVHVDGEAVKSCTLLAVQAEGADVLTIEGVANGDTAASDAGSLPQQPRAAMRLLHARHGDERARPREEQPEPERERGPRVSRRQSVPLHRLSQHRAGDHRGRGGDARRGAAAPIPTGWRRSSGDAAIDRPARPAARGLPVPDRTGNLYRRHQPAGAALRLSSCAARTPTRGSMAIDTSAAASAPGRRRGLHRQGHGGRRDRRAALRLADPFEGRLADDRAAAPGARGGPGAPCRRPGRRRDRREPRPGARRRRADRGRLRRRAGRRRSGRGAEARRAAGLARAGARAISATTGISATRPRSMPRSPRRRGSSSST